MSNCVNSEAEVIETLLDVAKASGVTAPRVVVSNRLQAERSMTRTVRFALIVPSNNETVLNALIAQSVDDDGRFFFIGSDVNLQGDMEIDYLYFEAKIMAKRI